MENKKRTRGPDKGPRKAYKQREPKHIINEYDNKVFYNAEDCAKYYHISSDYVRKICNNERNAPVGLELSYFKDYTERQHYEAVESNNWKEWLKDYKKDCKEYTASERRIKWRLELQDAIENAKKGVSW